MELRPRPVPARHIFRWFADGLRLSARQPLWFVVLVAVALPAGQWLGAMPLFLLLPSLLGCGVLLAFSSEQASSFLATVAGQCRGKALRLLAATLLAAPVVFFIASLLLLGAQLDEPSPAQTAAAAQSAFSFEPADILLVTLFLWFVAVGPILWFMVPLLVLETLPLKIAFALALKACLHNLYIAMVTSTLALVFLAGINISISAFPLYAIVVCAMYASYRDVFYGEALKMATAGSKRVTTLTARENTG